ncbi:hypothetical protein L596_011132 [Steinernema carpocapsae]|uniref:Uncharacterized protein n=1 Tax=Steinernema carpocapsae TaxID=34508 RepID=A0A4U5NTQ4_STECR|nr:hypothetical protein L596_011132 [Steinernema carpocapsae]
MHRGILAATGDTPSSNCYLRSPIVSRLLGRHSNVQLSERQIVRATLPPAALRAEVVAVKNLNFRSHHLFPTLGSCVIRSVLIE